jgi:glycosyltransferase involved in cell wall biosynthesis
MIIGIDASRAGLAQRTGTEAYAYHLIRALLPLAAERDHRVRLYFNQPPPPDLFDPYSHVETAVIPQRRLWTHTRLRAELRQRPPGVFFTPAHVIPVGVAVPSVATVHDLGYEYFPEAHTARQRAYLRWSTRHNGRRGRAVVADSEATRADLSRLYGVRPDKITVVYPGADPTLGPERDSERLAAVGPRYGIHSPYLLYLGTLQPRKNLLRLVEAFATSGLAANGYSLVLAGKQGWLAEPVLAAVAALDEVMAKAVVLPGYIDPADKAALLTGATALTFPSLYEGFGFPVLEAQACGTPVVTSTTSSLPEVAGSAALLVDPLDTAALSTALRRIVGDEPLRAQLRRDGLANVGRFRWGDSAAAVLDVLEAAA